MKILVIFSLFFALIITQIDPIPVEAPAKMIERLDMMITPPPTKEPQKIVRNQAESSSEEEEDYDEDDDDEDAEDEDNYADPVIELPDRVNLEMGEELSNLRRIHAVMTMPDRQLTEIGDKARSTSGDGENGTTSAAAEECLENRQFLGRDVQRRLERAARRLAGLVRQLNKLQAQYCSETQHTHYHQCASWRESKMAHYMQIMRITYCSDPSRWPGSGGSGNSTTHSIVGSQ